MKYSELEPQNYDIKQIIDNSRILIYSSKLNTGYEITFFKQISPDKLETMDIVALKKMSTENMFDRHFQDRNAGRGMIRSTLLNLIHNKKSIQLLHCGEQKTFDKSNKLIHHSYGFDFQSEGEVIEDHQLVLNNFRSESSINVFTGMTSSFSIGRFNAQIIVEDEEE